MFCVGWNPQKMTSVRNQKELYFSLKYSCCSTFAISASKPTLRIEWNKMVLCSQCFLHVAAANKQTNKWQSQPFLLGKFPAGNLLLSFATLCAGASITKILLVLKHMGVLVYHKPAFFYHQRHILFPSIFKFWKSYQSKLLNSLNGKEVVISGDARHDSVGHSAKYGTYTILCCTVGLIIEIVLMQVNNP